MPPQVRTHTQQEHRLLLHPLSSDAHSTVRGALEEGVAERRSGYPTARARNAHDSYCGNEHFKFLPSSVGHFECLSRSAGRHQYRPNLFSDLSPEDFEGAVNTDDCNPNSPARVGLYAWQLPRGPDSTRVASSTRTSRLQGGDIVSSVWPTTTLWESS